MEQPGCLICGGELHKFRSSGVYVWRCLLDCQPPLITGVVATEDITDFERAAVSRSTVDTGLFEHPVQAEHVPGVKVYMPFLLFHFISCGWGACYHSLFEHVIVPHLDSVEILDYVLRSRVVIDPTVSEHEPKMYGELYDYLVRVESKFIRLYLSSQFGGRYAKG
jgi:hypothetical protein